MLDIVSNIKKYQAIGCEPLAATHQEKKIMAVLDQITKAQETTIDLLVDGNENLVTWTRSANKQAQQFQKRMTKRVSKRTAKLDVPAPAEMVDTYFDFAGRTLELNRKFVGSVIDAWTPAAPAKKTSRPAAKKAAPKKAAARK